jgi:hypothetical protein
VPITLDRTLTADRIAFLTNNTFSGTASVRLGIYSDTNGVPSTLVLDAGTVSAVAASAIYQITISQSLTAGTYWLAFCQQSAPASASYIGISGGVNIQNSLDLGQSTVGGNFIQGYSQASVTGAFPSTMTPSANATVPHTWLRFA